MITPTLRKALTDLGVNIEVVKHKDGHDLDKVSASGSPIDYYFHPDGTVTSTNRVTGNDKVEDQLTASHQMLHNYPQHRSMLGFLLSGIHFASHHFLTHDKKYYIRVGQNTYLHNDKPYISVSVQKQPQDPKHPYKTVTNNPNGNWKDEDGNPLSTRASQVAKTVLQNNGDNEYALEDVLREDHPSLFEDKHTSYSRIYNKVIANGSRQ